MSQSLGMIETRGFTGCVEATALEILICGGCLAFLYMSKELLKQRSLWLTSGFFSILLCLTVSLILSFPG